jgi:ankyrin repeat protein
LIWAAAEGHAKVVEALIEAGADIRTRLQSGFTPLLFAARDGRSDVAAVLLKSGADVNDPVPGGKHLGYGGRLPPVGATHCSWP